MRSRVGGPKIRFAVVVQVRGRRALLLTDDGQLVKVAVTSAVAVGQRVPYVTAGRLHRRRRWHPVRVTHIGGPGRW